MTPELQWEFDSAVAAAFKTHGADPPAMPNAVRNALTPLSKAIRDAHFQCANGSIRTAVIRRPGRDAYEVVVRYRVPYVQGCIVVCVFAPSKHGVIDEPPAVVKGKADAEDRERAA